MRSLYAWTAALSATAALACSTQPDTEQKVRQALDQANMTAVVIDVDDEANIVHLKGTVGTMSDRTRAEEVASAVVGTSGRVLNELTVQGLNEETADDLDGDIVDTLEETMDRDANLKEREIDFDVLNGVVTIKGAVRSADEKNRVGEIVKAAPGVKDMANALEIRAE